MASSRLFFSLCLLFVEVLALAKAQQPVDQPKMSYHDCVGKGNYTTNSTYQANLNQLLTSIYTNTEINNAFYNFSYGQDADTVYSIALCVVLNSIHPEGQGRQPPAVTAQPPTGQPPAASHQLFAATAASRLHT